jgi:uncharacterized protein involved in exopolysaccharide biosynthesis
LIIPSVILAVVLALALSVLIPRSFEGRATLYVGQSLTEPNFEHGRMLTSQLLTQTYARLATTSSVLSAVASEMGLSQVTAETLAGRIRTEAPTDGTLITVVASADNPDEAAALANGVAGELVRRAPAAPPDQDAQRQAVEDLDTRIDIALQELLDLLRRDTLTTTQRAAMSRLEDRLSALQSARDSLAAGLAGRSPNAITIIDPALPPDVPAGPSSTVVVGMAGAVALALGVAGAYVLGDLRRRLHWTGTD